MGQSMARNKLCYWRLALVLQGVEQGLLDRMRGEIDQLAREADELEY
jgi:hypothetical protein